MMQKICWVISDGRPGMENEALGVAEAVGLPAEVKRIRPRAPWRWLPARLWWRPLASLGADSALLAPPWPALAIGCGRQSVPIVLEIGRLSGGHCFTVQLQHPRVDPALFGLVAPPEHDRLTGANVISTRGALHRVTPAKLAQAAAAFGPGLGPLPHPRIAVLIGGDNSAYRLTAALTRTIARRLKALATREGASLLVTPSRRTGPENERILRESLRGVPGQVWDGQGENPYFGYLGLADYVIATNDSVAMVSEACATGKPVFVLDLEPKALGRSRRKFEAFHAALRAQGLTRRFDDRLENWTYAPLNDTAVVAAAIRRHLGLVSAE